MNINTQEHKPKTKNTKMQTKKKNKILTRRTKNRVAQRISIPKFVSILPRNQLYIQPKIVILTQQFP